MGRQWSNAPELGVIGLRLDHLSRHAPTRAAVVNLLNQPNANPLTIAQNIPGPGGTVINVFDDDITAFENALDALTPGEAARYHAGAGNLRGRNQDTPADRAAFKTFWTTAATNNPALIPQMRTKLLTALQATNPGGAPKKLRFMWDCDLLPGTSPQVEHLELPEAFQVLFRTDDRDPPTP